MLKRSTNGHLHLAIVVALVAVSLIALAVPITGTKASSRERSRIPAGTAGQGLASALRGQAEMVTAMVAPGASTGNASATKADYLGRLRSVPGASVIPTSLLSAVGQLAAGAAFSSPETRASLIVQRPNAVSFTVHEEGMAVSHMTSQLTVGQALAGVGIKITPYDVIRPSPDTRLDPGMHVYITYAANVRLILNGREKIVYTRANSVADLFAEEGIKVEPTDRIFPKLTDPIRSGMAVSVIAIRDNVEFTEDPINYATVYQYDPDYAQGDEVVVRAGTTGYVRREYKIKRINGAEVSRELSSETVIPPTDEVVAIGTRVPSTPAPRTAPPAAAFNFDNLTCTNTVNVWATWYSAASAGGNGRTATGTGVYKGIVAVDPSVIPLGTRMYIPGYGYGLAADTGGGIRGYMIDLGYGPDDVVDWHTRTVDICILN